MSTSLAALAVELRATRPNPSSKGYPRGLRARVVVAARVARSEGTSLAEASKALGLSPTSLQRWLRASSPPPTFIPVIVEPSEDVGESRAGSAESTSQRALCLVSPGGYRVEGLGLDALILLLGQLP